MKEKWGPDVPFIATLGYNLCHRMSVNRWVKEDLAHDRKRKQLSARSYQRLHTISSSIPQTLLSFYLLLSRVCGGRKEHCLSDLVPVENKRRIYEKKSTRSDAREESYEPWALTRECLLKLGSGLYGWKETRGRFHWSILWLHLVDQVEDLPFPSPKGLPLARAIMRKRNRGKEAKRRP